MMRPAMIVSALLGLSCLLPGCGAESEARLPNGATAGPPPAQRTIVAHTTTGDMSSGLRHEWVVRGGEAPAQIELGYVSGRDGRGLMKTDATLQDPNTDWYLRCELQAVPLEQLAKDLEGAVGRSLGLDKADLEGRELIRYRLGISRDADWDKGTWHRSQFVLLRPGEVSKGASSITAGAPSVVPSEVGWPLVSYRAATEEEAVSNFGLSSHFRWTDAGFEVDEGGESVLLSKSGLPSWVLYVRFLSEPL